MTKIQELARLGQSIWLDYIRRSFIDSGELQAWIDRGLRGVTSNPSIFEKAITGSADYDQDLRELVNEGKTIQEIYESLALDDIGRAADLLYPVYEQTNGLDGYVSLEADPTLANDTAGTIAEIKHFYQALDRPNVMFKVPATPAGIPAIEQLIAAGINVNVTLIFGRSQYEDVANAYIAGLEQLTQAGGNVSQVASVASFFVSRVDTAVDRALDEIGETGLQGKIAVANAKLAYARFKAIFAAERWQRLAGQGGRVQRLLWGSTSTKNPAYSDVKYVDELIGPDTVNTVPPNTLQLFIDHGTVAPTLEQGVQDARADLDRLAELGIDLDAITQKLLEDGVAAFAKSFESLLISISEKQERLLAEWEQMSVSLGDDQAKVDTALQAMDEQKIVSRIWARDHTVWKPDPTEIVNRLGWLDIAEKMIDNTECLEALVDNLRAEGYTHAVLLGMGGSSLAADMLQKTFGTQPGYLELSVLDSTDPDAVLAQAQQLDPAHTLFIVATKSGSTAETLSLFKYFYNWTMDALGVEATGKHFVAITDPDSNLVTLARDYDFRTTFLNDPNIGGRYSALSYFGLVPASLIGVDVVELLNRALTMSCNCASCNCATGGNNGGALLGASMGELALTGRDKLTFIATPGLVHFADWVEQLVAESTGKEGKGIVPIVREPVGAPEVYGSDRLFVYLRLDGSNDHDAEVERLQQAGYPLIRLRLRDLYDLGQQFFLWEMAVAIACQRLHINPFDQPNVEAAKSRAREMIDTYKEKGKLPQADQTSPSPAALADFLDQASPGEYVTFQAYIQPTPESDRALQRLRVSVRDRYKLATTVGYGPRFLHSTGQLHKGDDGSGLFIQLTANDEHDVAIPDQAGSPASSITFGILISAQAMGDQQALLDADRRVIRFHLRDRGSAGIMDLVEPTD